MTSRAWLSALLLAAACTLEEQPRTDGGTSSAKDAGAGTADGGRDGGAGMGIHAGNACTLLNASRCDALQRCGLLSAGTEPLVRCAAALGETECGPALWPSRVTAGTLRLLPQVVAACAEAWASRPCDLVLKPPEVCDDFLQPSAGNGGPCYGGPWAECPEGDVCRGLACPRSCRAPGNAGEDCSGDEECQTDAGLTCRPAGDGRTGYCAARAGPGETCDQRTRCAAGLFCDASGSCMPLLSARTPCASSGDCLETLFCSLNADGGGTCVPRMPDGTTCASSAQCRPGSVCVPQSGRCAPRGPLARAASCGTGQSCTGGLTCAGRTAEYAGLCLPPLGVDAPCVGHDDCEPHLACIVSDVAGQQRRCGRRQEQGLPCDSDRACQAFSECMEGTCTALPLAGSPCAGGACLHGSCVPHAAGGGLCAGLLGPNAACTTDGDCASGRCVAGACLAACAP